MKYLIDSLQSFENGYNDALCPTCVDVSKTFLGEGDLLRPVTVHDLHMFATAFMTCAHSASMTPCATPPPFQDVTLTANTLSLKTLSITNSTISTTPKVIRKEDLPLVEHSLDDVGVIPQSTVGSTITNSFITFTGQKKEPLKDHPPIPGIFIPNIGRKRGSWREAVRQWEEGDPSIGLVPLKD